MFPLDDTIAAVATAPRNAPRGIVRLSGPQVRDCVANWFQSDEDWSGAKSAKVYSGQLTVDDVRAMPCDLYFWPNQKSYTRQPTIELHTLGATSLLQRVLANVCQTGARLANPGEFTLRAFLSGRLDLAQAEAVLGIIDAEGDQQFDVALRQLAGGISNSLQDLRGQLLDLCADLEAGLDFVEEDIQFVTSTQITQRLTQAIAIVDGMHQQMAHRTVCDQLPAVVLAGLPNVGKSSLLNALLDRDAAIVSDTAGTTRDYVASSAVIHGFPCELIDTAGIQSVANGPGAEAQEMTTAAMERSQVTIVCIDLSRQLTDEEHSLLSNDSLRVDLIVGTKNDLLGTAEFDCDVFTSSTTGAGLDELRQLIADRLAADASYRGETVGPTAVRCRDSLRECSASLTSAVQLTEQRMGDELIAADLRRALDYLGQVVGTIYTDDVLDRVFSRFCIGK